MTDQKKQEDPKDITLGVIGDRLVFQCVMLGRAVSLLSVLANVVRGSSNQAHQMIVIEADRAVAEITQYIIRLMESPVRNRGQKPEMNQN